ncbi:MAG: STAS domain-containing protein, partial [Pirellulaceae bacterium]|nr:STAS domain-containing protein [Pirellulaceae bacterium]
GTIIAVLATDLLIGFLVGIAIELLIQFVSGVPFSSLFLPRTEVRQVDHNTWLVCPRDSAVFANWLQIRAKIEQFGLQKNMNIVLDLSNTQLVDHTVMHKLHQLEAEFAQRGIALAIVGLDDHVSFSNHPTAARLRGAPRPPTTSGGPAQPGAANGTVANGSTVAAVTGKSDE